MQVSQFLTFEISGLHGEGLLRNLGLEGSLLLRMVVMALASNFPMTALNPHLRSTLNSFPSKGRAVGRWRIIIRQRVR